MTGDSGGGNKCIENLDCDSKSVNLIDTTHCVNARLSKATDYISSDECGNQYVSKMENNSSNFDVPLNCNRCLPLVDDSQDSCNGSVLDSDNRKDSDANTSVGPNRYLEGAHEFIDYKAGSHCSYTHVRVIPSLKIFPVARFEPYYLGG